MSSEPSDPVLMQLSDIASSLGRVEAELGALKERVYAVEMQLGRSLLNQTQFQVQVAALIGRIDRFEDRFARIERRLAPEGGR